MCVDVCGCVCAQGFQWACREGPLCDEPVRNVKFRMLDAGAWLCVCVCMFPSLTSP